MRSIKILNLVPTVFFLLFLLTGISHSQENVQSIVPKTPVQKGGLESVLLGGLEKDQDLVKEGFDGNYSLGGVGAVLSNQSSMFMKFNGMRNDSGYFHGNADLSYHRGSYFANFLAEDIGFKNRNLLLDFGKYDDYKLTASFSQSSQLLTDNSKTPLEGLGGSSFTLPAGFVTGPSGATISVTGVKDSDLKVDGRDTAVFGFLKSVGKNTFGLNYKRETKKGSRSLGAVVGTNGGNARSIVLPETFDQTTNEMSASFLHVDENSQLKVEYFLSLFDNRIESVTFQSPYSGDIDLGGGVVNAPSAGLLSRAPDNTYHRFSASGRWNLSRTARVSAVMEYGLMSQDDKLFAFALGTSTDLLPRQSAEAKTHSLHFNLNASARPLKNLSVNTRYRHYQTINDTPSTLFLAVVNDTEGQVAGNSARALISQPYDTTQDQVKLDASYRVFKATHFKLGYEVELMQRSHRAVEESWENKFKGSIRSTFIPNTSINLKGSFAKKVADEYDAFQIFSDRHTASYVTGSLGFDSLPELRRLDVANRDRSKLGANISWFPSDFYTLGINYQYQEDDHPESPMGLRTRRNQNVTFDVNYSPSDTQSIFLFYTFSKMDAEQNGRDHNQFAAGSANDVTRNWRVDHDDKTHTIGLGSRTKFMENRLTLNVDYSFTQSISNTTFAAGSNAVVANPTEMPNLGTVRHSFETIGEYKINENLSWGIRYLYENYKEDDFATDSFDPGSVFDTGTIASVIPLTGSNQDFNGHLFMVFASYQLGN